MGTRVFLGVEAAGAWG